MEVPKKFSGEKYNLRWNSHKNTLISHLGNHLLEEGLVDVTLACEGKYIKAHKVILSACSDYFKELFQVHKVDNPLIIMNNVEFEQLKHIIEFIYKGEIKVLDSNLKGILLLGNNLKIKGLSNFKDKNSVTNKAPEVSEGNLSGSKVDGNISDSSNTTKDGKDIRSSPKKKAEIANTEFNKVDSDKSVPKIINVEVLKNNNKRPRAAIPKVAKVSIECGSSPVVEISNSKTLGNGMSEKMSDLALNEHHLESHSMKKRKTTNDAELMETNQMKTTESQMNSAMPSPSSIVDEHQNVTKIEIHDTNIEEEIKNSTTTELATSNPLPLKRVSAFMIFANEWRKNVALEHPNDNNKQISLRLSNMWKNLTSECKEGYYEAASREYEKRKLILISDHR